MILHEDFTNPPRAGWACPPCNQNCDQGRQCPGNAPSNARDKSAQRIGMMVLLTSAAIVIAGVLWALSWLRS